MNTLSKYFAGRLFTLGYRAAYWSFRRPAVQAVVAEPDRTAPVGPHLDWFAPSSGGARTWADFASDTQRPQAE
jgi:hypothetical protein